MFISVHKCIVYSGGRDLVPGMDLLHWVWISGRCGAERDADALRDPR